MKKSVKTIAVITSTLALTLGASAQNFLITVDEQGNGTANGTVLPSFMKADPFSGIITLAYQLPFAGVPGDVQLFEPSTVQPLPLSDIIRFDGHNFMYFFSETEPGELNPDKADVAQFPPPLTGFQTVQLLENGPEGNNGATYAPGAGPGGDAAFNPSYNFISDVPEPSAGILAALGGSLMFVSRCVRRARRE